MSSHHGTPLGIPSNLLAFPSLSSSLHALPQATNIQNVALHRNMYGKLASEAKLQKALKANSRSQPRVYSTPPLTPMQCCDSSRPTTHKPVCRVLAPS
ncbi:hypothetical protein CYLTODRAFT_460304 [Cylindrobasidium torrendii FP15055 ss-10]|uniref:Uncharacterized protein n=1 Tax=Cylindrobasidium torrendii FP15055 ss-10 TaxID=1314674 RepID=A0A0D7ASV5_9AGAR|nr:hypothetical protein CYLTODRAFT_460304 [Cylindrobasidium torrendii FP15055 ss-10]